MRDVRGPAAATQQTIWAWGYDGSILYTWGYASSVLETLFVHEDMQYLPLGEDVGHYFWHLFLLHNPSSHLLDPLYFIHKPSCLIQKALKFKKLRYNCCCS